MPEEKAKRKKIKATGQMQKIMADYFYELNDAAKSGDKKIAWCTSVGPAEILRGMGFLVHFPENHGAMLGATRMATDLIPQRRRCYAKAYYIHRQADGNADPATGESVRQEIRHGRTQTGIGPFP